jgi:hypothetical protein
MYAPQGLLDPNIWTEQQLLALKDRCFELLLEGKTIMNYLGEGTSAGRQFVMPIPDMLQEITWSLKSQNPQKYGYRSDRSQVYFM